ncbi:carboxymuconolactone decarboxylase family protein [Microbacterium pygmaeum]|uniref:Alkylhydroperoxidase AhpD family core domain-containing protein n=1 Tax=Microbacterium pygmaeum TaxID=370764 RepID=A0A1G7XLM9_9MICO|nr:carboxymuconolactone decarboxylase family protein [Microbacterium pygmaeum]SDG85087.1 alkylhydroperoxidase AhpD family core domain-containing protein [Microbacterium pygmaeum]
MSSEIRVPLVEPGSNPALAAIEADIRAERGGEIAVLYRALLNSAPVADGWEKLLTAIRNRSTTPSTVRELVILRVAVLNRADFEFAAHVPHAKAAGVTSAQLDAVQRDAGPGPFSEQEHLALALTDAMTTEIEVPDALMQRIQSHFDARGVVELVATVAAYNMVSRFLVALNIRH